MSKNKMDIQPTLKMFKLMKSPVTAELMNLVQMEHVEESLLEDKLIEILLGCREYNNYRKTSEKAKRVNKIFVVKKMEHAKPLDNIPAQLYDISWQTGWKRVDECYPMFNSIDVECFDSLEGFRELDFC